MTMDNPERTLTDNNNQDASKADQNGVAVRPEVVGSEKEDSLSQVRLNAFHSLHARGFH